MPDMLAQNFMLKLYYVRCGNTKLYTQDIGCQKS
jgi:hypothetical protein